MQKYAEYGRWNSFVSIPIFTGSFGSGKALWLFHCNEDSRIRFGVEYNNVHTKFNQAIPPDADALKYFLKIEGSDRSFEFTMSTTCIYTDQEPLVINKTEIDDISKRCFYKYMSMPFDHNVAFGTHWVSLVKQHSNHDIHLFSKKISISLYN